MKTYAYDIETLRNLFTAIFVNVEDKTEVHTFCIGVGRNDRDAMLEFLDSEILLVGYNNHSFDDPVLRYIASSNETDTKKLVKKIYELASMLVSDGYRGDKKILALRYPRFKDRKEKWSTLDLMKMLAFDTMGISLKQTSINLKWHKIQDMPINHDAIITEETLPMVLEYNLNDVLITDKLYEDTKPLRELRIALSKLYGVDLTSASDSKMANLILEKIYTEETKIPLSSLRKKGTQRNKVLLGNCIASFVEFKTPQLKELLQRVSSTYVYAYNKFKYAETISYGGCTFSLGVGGLHTNDSPGIFETTDKFIIQDMDVASYYPNLIINNNFYPEHLGPQFIEILKKITEERIKAKAIYNEYKAKGDLTNPEAVFNNTKQAGLKITINSIFGKLGSEHFWLLDPKQMLSTTVSGQLGLLMLVESLTLAGIPVISANTDGVVCKIPVELEDKYYEIAKDWEEKTNLVLEYTPYKKYIRRDVNSYITQKPDGTTKEKGAFVKKVNLKKAYKMPIVPKALYEYFINGVPVRETLEKCTDIFDFCMSQKTGSQFVTEYHTINGVTELQKTNRFFVTNKGGGALVKRSTYTDRTTSLIKQKMVRILNDYDKDVPFEDYHVDLNFYEAEVMKIVNEIEPKQINLFNIDAYTGYIPKMEIGENVTVAENTLAKTASEINKLGIHQFRKRLSKIVEAGETIADISPRYVCVEDVNEVTKTVSVYCLAKAVRQTLKVDEIAFNTHGGMMVGQLVFCEKFKKNNDGTFEIAKYRIDNELRMDEERLLQEF